MTTTLKRDEAERVFEQFKEAVSKLADVPKVPRAKRKASPKRRKT